MLINDTPVENYLTDYGLKVKREDLCCPLGPHFSKTRGVFSHLDTRPESVIGVLDTYHSQGGWAVAQACKAVGKKCMLFYPVYKHHEFDPLKPQQAEALKLGAELHPLPAGRSAVLYHRAKKITQEAGGYMYPNALKLFETVDETAKELSIAMLKYDLPSVMVVAASSGTIASGLARVWPGTLIIHQGYSRSREAIKDYVHKMAGEVKSELVFVDEGYNYKDVAKEGITPPWPCNKYYDLKAFRWWVNQGRDVYQTATLWNVG